MKLRTYLNTLLPSWLEEISQHGWRKSHSNLAQFLVPKDDKIKLVKNKAVMGAITNTWISNKFQFLQRCDKRRRSFVKYFFQVEYWKYIHPLMHKLFSIDFMNEDVKYRSIQCFDIENTAPSSASILFKSPQNCSLLFSRPPCLHFTPYCLHPPPYPYPIA